jgi:hypothetical protein
MNAKELAEKLNGCQYREEVSKELAAQAKENNLVIVFGASDDLMEFRGAIDDEIGAYEGTTAYLTADGLLNASKCPSGSYCLYFDKEKAAAKKIKAIWCDYPGDIDCEWSYETDIPHATFDVMSDDRDGSVYCRGIVFSLDDLKEAPQGLTQSQARIIADGLDIYEGAEVFDDPNVDGEVVAAYRALLKIAQTED